MDSRCQMTVSAQELHFHVEECLSRNLHVRCSGLVHNVLRTCVQHMNGNHCLSLEQLSCVKCWSFNNGIAIFVHQKSKIEQEGLCLLCRL